MKNLQNKWQNGQIALSMALVVMIIAVISTTSAIGVSQEIKRSTLDYEGTQALVGAETGIETGLNNRDENVRSSSSAPGSPLINWSLFRKEESIEHFLKKGEVIHLKLEKNDDCSLNVEWDQISAGANLAYLWLNFYATFPIDNEKTNNDYVSTLQLVLAPFGGNNKFDVAQKQNNNEEYKNKKSISIKGETSRTGYGSWMNGQMHFLRLTNLTKDTKIKLSGDCKPTMYNAQSAVSNQDNSNRSLRVKETYPTLPNFFDYSLLTTSVTITPP